MPSCSSGFGGLWGFSPLSPFFFVISAAFCCKAVDYAIQYVFHNSRYCYPIFLKGKIVPVPPIIQYDMMMGVPDEKGTPPVISAATVV
jgi:hypothetical protein